LAGPAEAEIQRAAVGDDRAARRGAQRGIVAGHQGPAAYNRLSGIGVGHVQVDASRALFDQIAVAADHARERLGQRVGREDQSPLVDYRGTRVGDHTVHLHGAAAELHQRRGGGVVRDRRVDDERTARRVVCQRQRAACRERLQGAVRQVGADRERRHADADGQIRHREGLAVGESDRSVPRRGLEQGAQAVVGFAGERDPAFGAF